MLRLASANCRAICVSGSANSKHKLRVLELPERKVGEAVETPFVFVLDRCRNLEDAHSFWKNFMNAETAADRSGMKAVLVFAEEVELP